MESLVVSSGVEISEENLKFTFSRSGGPGGQNVNKVNSKATLHFLVTDDVLPEAILLRFREKFATRITAANEVVIVSQEYRDQPKNVASCLEKLREMVVSVLAAPKKRRPTKPSKGAKLRRLNDKRQRSQVKQGRRSSGRDD